MTTPRGNIRTIIQKVGEIQNLVGEAKGLHEDDQNKEGFTKAQANLEKAFELCLEIRNMYDPI